MPGKWLNNALEVEFYSSFVSFKNILDFVLHFTLAEEPIPSFIIINSPVEEPNIEKILQKYSAIMEEGKA